MKQQMIPPQDPIKETTNNANNNKKNENNEFYIKEIPQRIIDNWLYYLETTEKTAKDGTISQDAMNLQEWMEDNYTIDEVKAQAEYENGESNTQYDTEPIEQLEPETEND